MERIMDDIAKLKAENDKLKLSNENLRQALKTYEIPEVVKVLTDWRTGELDLRINKYKQTLKEIKGVVTALYMNNWLQMNETARKSIQLLQDLITKAEEE